MPRVSLVRRAEMFAGQSSLFVQQDLCKRCQYKQVSGKEQYVHYNRASPRRGSNPGLPGPQPYCWVWPEVFVVYRWGIAVCWWNSAYTFHRAKTSVFLLTIKMNKITLKWDCSKQWPLGRWARMKSTWEGRSSAGGNKHVPTHLLSYSSDPTAVGKAHPPIP